MKPSTIADVTVRDSRTPRGVRGLKLQGADQKELLAQSHPARGAWIETIKLSSASPALLVAPREGCVD